MGYYPTPSKSSSGGTRSSPSTSTPTSKTDTDKKVESSSKYVGGKYTPVAQPAGTPVQTINVSGGGSSSKTIAARGATQADVNKFQQNVQTTSNIRSNINPQSQAVRNWNNQINPQRDVSVMPGVTPQLSQGGYIVSTQGGYKSPTPRYLPATEENRSIVQKEIKYQTTGTASQTGKAKITPEVALMALPVPEGFLFKGLGGGTKAVAAVQRAEAPAEAGLIRRGATVVSEKATGLYNRVAPTKAYKYTKNAAIGIGTAETVRYGITEGSALGLSKEDRAIRNDPAFKQAVGTAYAKTGSEAFNQAWYKGAAYNIPGVPLVMGKKTFETTARTEFEKQGYTGAAADRRVSLAMGELYAGQIGESAGFLSISRSSEKIGRGLIAGSFEKAAAKSETATTKTISMNLFKKTAPNIAAAGVVEGVGSEIVQERARNQQIDYKQIGLMGVFGGASAGLIGGTIAATSVKRPVVSKTLETAAFISDPYEKPGDMIQNLIEGGNKRFYGITPPKSQVFTATDPKDLIGFGGQRQKSPVKETPGKVYAFSPTNIFTNVPTTTTTNKQGSAQGIVGTPSVIPPSEQTRTNFIIKNPLTTGTGTQTQTKKVSSGGRGASTPTNIFTNANTNILNPTITTVNNQPAYRTPTVVNTNPFNITPDNRVPTNPFTNTPTTTTTTTTTDTTTNPLTNVPVNPTTTIPVNPFTSINVPTTVPVGRIPPPMPLSFGDLFGGGASYGGKRKQYINEIAAGSNLLDNLMFNRKITPIGKHIKTTSLQAHRNKQAKAAKKKHKRDKK